MEKQKIFWVVLAVSIFVVIVLVVGVYLLQQKPQAVTSAPGTINPISGQGTQVYEYAPEKPQSQAQPQAPQTGQKPGQPETMHFYIGEGQQKPPAENPPSGPAQPLVQVPPAPQPAVQQPSQQARPQVQQPLTPAVKPPAAPPRTAAAPARKPSHPVKQASRPAPARHGVDYWIQTGSYKSQSKAEDLVALLADKGLSGRVFSYAAKNETYYRVRIGPYTNPAEASKFLSIVKQIQGLESSFISQVGGTRNVN